jgi:hypothetical protein
MFEPAEMCQASRQLSRASRALRQTRHAASPRFRYFVALFASFHVFTPRHFHAADMASADAFRPLYADAAAISFSFAVTEPPFQPPLTYSLSPAATLPAADNMTETPEIHF